MAFRADVTVDWTQSPRLIFVAPPSTTISIQDLVDTLRIKEEQPWEGLVHPSIIEAAGKEDLGGGVFVGITAKLLNARIAFESRKDSVESGTITTPDANGVTINDSSGLFITNSVQPGSWVVNLNDGSRATVLRVVSETQLITDGLGDGIDNQFDNSDLYEIQNVIQCDVNGGNLVAVAANGIDPISAILPTMGTQAVRTSSSSATITEVTLLEQAKFLIEGLRKDHNASGNIFYWDPVFGNNTFDGTSPSKPRKTFASIDSDLLTDGNGDIVFVVRSSPGTIIITERIAISKSSVFIRCPGNTSFIPSNHDGPTVDITGNNVELTGCALYQLANGHSALRVNGGNFRFENAQVITSTGYGIELYGGSANFIERTLIRDCSLDGIFIKDTLLTTVENTVIRDCDGYGIRLEATSPGSTSITLVDHGLSQTNAMGGAYIGSGVYSTTFTDRFHSSDHNGQPVDYIDFGTFTSIIVDHERNHDTSAVWNALKSSHTTPGTMGNDLATKKDVITTAIVLK